MSHEEIKLRSGIAEDAYPVIGETTTGLGEYLVRSGKLSNLDGYARIRRDALSIVKRSRKFTEKDGSRTGLVIGYVQSGKTMSMECVSSLARDNGCRIIILLAGVTTNLLKQNAERFTTDLRAASGKNSAWRIFNSDEVKDQDRQLLEGAIAEWRDPDFPDMEPRTFLFMVLKNHAHLDKVHGLLSSVNLKGIPALILDDEADQAGLNTAPDKEDASTTYRKIAALRAALPHHTYLQYTATPQAPLLIALDDMLSPAFAELVEPGEGYTGGHAFFGAEAPKGLVRLIPQDDQFRPGAPPDEPPESLLEAMRVFFVGCAVAAMRGKPTPRSMLVHPSQRRNDHKAYLGWISGIVQRWTETLRGRDENDKRDTLDEFRTAYADLATTENALPPFDALIPHLIMSLSRQELTEVNSDGTEIDWKNAEVHILVGGEKLNRGFTVEGLTVTYMPRDAGGWNADTLQQRARFFGYKKSYLGLCRLYLHPDVVSAFRSYVVHEDDIRQQLANHRGKPLKEWRRAFFLDSAMRPTRRNVLSDPYYRIEAAEPWFRQRNPHGDTDAITRNRALLDQAAAKQSFSIEAARFRKHQVADAISLKAFFEDVLLAYQVRGVDVAGWYGQLVLLTDIIDSKPDTVMVLLKMSGERERTDNKGGIAIHQGRSSKDGGYPGDAAMIDSDVVTVQMHRIDVKDRPSLKNVPALAIHIPTDLRKADVVVQPKGG